MYKMLFGFALLFVSLTSICSRTTAPQNRVLTSKADDALPANASGGVNHATDDPGLRQQIEQIALAARGRVGVAAVVLETGDSVSLDPNGHFPMQSVYKLPIGMAVMKQVDAGKLRLEQKVLVTKDDFINPGQHSPIRDKNPGGAELCVRELMEWMLLESDGTASDVLMKLAGGPTAVQAYLSELKITDMVILNTEKELGQDRKLQYLNWATPEAAVALLRALHERRGLSEASQALLLKLMVESTPGAKRLKGLLPAGTMVAHKTGTSGTVDLITAATNDIGLVTLPYRSADGAGGAPVRNLAIAVFVSDSRANENTREGVIAKVARAVWDRFSVSK